MDLPARWGERFSEPSPKLSAGPWRCQEQLRLLGRLRLKKKAPLHVAPAWRHVLRSRSGLPSGQASLSTIGGAEGALLEWLPATAKQDIRKRQVPVLLDSDTQSMAHRKMALVRRFGRHGTSFQVLAPCFSWWFADADAGVAYVDTGAAWVAAGPPLCALPREQSVAAAFVAEAYRRRRRVVFFAASAAVAKDPDYTSLVVGQEPWYTPSAWAGHRVRSATVRQQIRRARHKQLAVRQIDPAALAGNRALRAHIEALIERWSGAHAMPPMGFLVDLNVFECIYERTFWLAEVPGGPDAACRIVGFAVAIPIMATGAIMIEHVLRCPDAPNGCAEALVDAVLTDMGHVPAASLGLAPLRAVGHPVLRLVSWAFSGLYRFEGLARFKAKLGPVAWDDVPVVWPKQQWLLVSLYDVGCAFVPQGLWRFAAGIVGRGSSTLLRLLAWLLVPWTLGLASMEGDKWFPSRALQLFWVGFDVFLAAGLFALSYRWRRSLATWLAALVTCDAVTTCIEASVYREPKGWSADLVRLVACAAPSATAWVLWNARAYRSRFRLKGQPQPGHLGKK